VSPSPGFDRLRPRSAAVPAAQPQSVDVEGRRALFSTAVPIAAMGSMQVRCSGCNQTTVLSLRQAARCAMPSLTVPLVRRGYPTYARCPACRQRTWLSFRVGLGSGRAGRRPRLRR
jgi:uncharacterized protein with PIN domain